MKGQVLVEFALVLPVLILLVFCFMQLAVLYNTYFIVNYASFCGARAAIVHTEFPDIPQVFAKRAAVYILLALQPGPELLATMVSSRYYYSEIEVTVTYPVRVFVPGLSGFLPFVPVSVSTRLPVER